MTTVRVVPLSKLADNAANCPNGPGSVRPPSTVPPPMTTTYGLADGAFDAASQTGQGTQRRSNAHYATESGNAQTG